ncbi:MAG: hypothetical protein KDE27_21345 [Planctomycetes bacterium]|nr:hypothetical protein [Planctomycetota bacterium]
MRRSCALLAAALALGETGPAQAAGVDLVLSHGSVQHGAPCSPFSPIGHFPWIRAGETWQFAVYTAPLTTHLILFGPPPTSSSAIPGIENLLLVHVPISIPIVGVTGPLDPASACSQGRSAYLLTVPPGPSPGYDFSVQLLGLSSTTGNWAFATNHWLTYL